MTDRVQTLTVYLDRAIRVDDIEELKQAIRCLRCVRSVENGDVDWDLWAVESAKNELRQQLRDILWPPYGKK